MSDQEKDSKASLFAGLTRLAKAVGIIAALVLVEVVGAAMLIPSAEETEKLARELSRAAKGEDAEIEQQDGATVDAGVVTREVELLTDNITRFNPDSDTTLNVDFSVYGVVLADEEEDFLKEFQANTSRIHEQIMLTIHAAESADLANAGLGLIKRQILEKTNRSLGRPMVREVVFTKLNFIER
ncbi:hypothetical protein Pla108_12700 [Botrimarina colliarenosi]|uniref:Flagellar protein FliL n=1 Tax=Botrimarina colliarenosi TaxID=2528001 RepID=A0A5C6ALP0_9BACT|nr:flagellar basal body-associated FliL family protein [Botrimarina colliarenosi]TWU00321.1 hypothetical protein Pla108_12700 [Botrimarina colliarenosi]